MAAYIKKEDVSTENIYEYDFDYETGEFSGYWLKFKYVDVPMDTKDPFAPEQDGNAYAVYDCYLFDIDDISTINETYYVDYFYVDKDTYDDLVEDEDEILGTVFVMPYEITDGIMTVNKFYIPDNFNIEDYIPEEPVEPDEPDEPTETAYLTPETTYNEETVYLNNLLLTDNLTGNEAIPDMQYFKFTGHLDAAYNDDEWVSPGWLSFRNLEDPNDEISYIYIQYMKDTTNNHHVIEIDVCGTAIFEGYIEDDSFDITEDHEYVLGLFVDESNHVTVSFEVDGTELSNNVEIDNFYDVSEHITEELTDGNAVISVWKDNLWLFDWTHDVLGSNVLHVNEPFFYYSGISVSNDGMQGPDSGWYTWTATDGSTLSNGTDIIRLSIPETTQEDPQE